MDMDDVERLYSPDEAEEIADRWDELVEIITKEGDLEWVSDVLNWDTLVMFAQNCREYYESSEGDEDDCEI